LADEDSEDSDPRATSGDRAFKDKFGAFLKKGWKPISWTTASSPVEAVPIAHARRQIIHANLVSLLVERLEAQEQ
jgi:hypothetical protein